MGQRSFVCMLSSLWSSVFHTLWSSVFHCVFFLQFAWCVDRAKGQDASIRRGQSQMTKVCSSVAKVTPLLLLSIFCSFSHMIWCVLSCLVCVQFRTIPWGGPGTSCSGLARMCTICCCQGDLSLSLSLHILLCTYATLVHKSAYLKFQHLCILICVLCGLGKGNRKLWLLYNVYFSASSNPSMDRSNHATYFSFGQPCFLYFYNIYSVFDEFYRSKAARPLLPPWEGRLGHPRASQPHEENVHGLQVYNLEVGTGSWITCFLFFCKSTWVFVVVAINCSNLSQKEKLWCWLQWMDINGMMAWTAASFLR